MSIEGVPTGVGAPLRRREDRRLLRGRGVYSDDINLAGQAHAAMVRSPHAHAEIRSIDVSAATAAPGVLAVLTGADYGADGIGDLGHVANPAGAEEWQTPAFVNRDGSVPFDAPQPPIVSDRIRHAGEIVAVVIAETGAAARDAVDLVAVDYETLPVVTDALAAIEPDAPLVWDDCAENTRRLMPKWATRRRPMQSLPPPHTWSRRGFSIIGSSIARWNLVPRLATGMPLTAS
jgi:carbon-monoxide dehydrogenase large subunit